MLDELFTADCLAALERAQNPSLSLQLRLAVVRASAEVIHGEGISAVYNRSKKSAWSQYVHSAAEAGLLDDDLRNRLTGTDDAGFRSALSEVMTYHFLTRTLGLTVDGRPVDAGRPGRVLDFVVRLPDGDHLGLEVKSPYADPPVADIWSGDNAHLVERAINEANKQFERGKRNVLVVAPFVARTVLSGKRPFMKALYGEEQVVMTIDTETGRRVGEAAWEFQQVGKLLKWHREGPRFTRTGAVLVLRELETESILPNETLSVTWRLKPWLLHNPHSSAPIPKEPWGDLPQFVVDGDVMRWTDGSPVSD